MQLFDVYALQNITITKGEGSFVWDDRGNKYLDMYGGHAVISIGHAHPHWVHAVHQQLNTLPFYSNSVHLPIQKKLAELLGQVSEKKEYQLFLCNSGAEANENAIKLASFVTGRKKLVAFTGAFHGRTSMAVAATDNPSIVAPINKTDNVAFLPFNDVAALENYFERFGAEVAAVITEGIQGVGGIVEASGPFLSAVRKLCTDNGALFIADSVQCGYGRSGNFFSHDSAGVSADIYTMAKGMGNGFPVGGIAIAPHITPVKGALGTTFGGNPLACAAAIAVLEVMQRENLIETAGEKGDYLKKQLAGLPGITNLRGRGLMIGFDVPEHFASLRTNLLYRHRVFTGEAKPYTVRLLPALNISYEEMDLFVHSLKQALAEINSSATALHSQN